MSPIEIRAGLRKLEFAPVRSPDAESTQYVTVEFARAMPLDQEETVSVVLGRRDGVLRKLEGRAQFIETKRTKSGREEHVYRLQGPVSTRRD